MFSLPLYDKQGFMPVVADEPNKKEQKLRIHIGAGHNGVVSKG